MPVFKKALGKIYGIEFSKAEKDAMEKELRSQMIEYDRMHENEIDAMMLLALHKLAGVTQTCWFWTKKTERILLWISADVAAAFAGL